MKNKRNGSKPAKQNNNNNAEVKALTAMVKKLTTTPKPKQPSGTPLGRTVLSIGDAISGFFGGGKIFGSGAYKLQGGNTSWDVGNQVPAMHTNSSNIRLAHKEYVGQVTSSSAFTIQYNESVNPTNQVLFPYLSGIASSFQEYRFKGLCFYFKSTSADALNSTNTALGAIIMAAQYRADAPDPIGKVQMLNEMWSTDGKPSTNIGMPLECSPAECPLNILYCGDGSSGSNDPKFFDLAKFFLASQGSQATADVGELWVTYDIELYKPILSLSTGPYSSNCGRYSGIAATTAFPIGVQVKNKGYGLPFAVSYTAGVFILTITSPGLGSVFNVQLMAVSATTSSITFNAVAGATLALTYQNNTANGVSTTPAAVSPYSSTFQCFLVSDVTAGSDIAIQFNCAYVGATTTDLFIQQVVPSLIA